MRSTRRRQRRIAMLATVAAAALVAAAGAQAATARVATPRCGAGQLSAKVRQGSGAAGTIGQSIALRNVSSQACSLRGFPRLRLIYASVSLPTHTIRGGLAIFQQPVKTVTIAPGHRASLLVAYSDVPSGGATSCPRSTRLVIFLGGGHGRLSTAFPGRPCRGTLFESPFLAGLVNV